MNYPPANYPPGTVLSELGKRFQKLDALLSILLIYQKYRISDTPYVIYVYVYKVMQDIYHQQEEAHLLC